MLSCFFLNQIHTTVSTVPKVIVTNRDQRILSNFAMYALVICMKTILCLMRTCFQPKFNRNCLSCQIMTVCVISRSNEAKARNRNGSARFSNKRIVKQHDVQYFSSNYALYGDLSNRVMKTWSSLHQM
jgi:hypothetical protein